MIPRALEWIMCYETGYLLKFFIVNDGSFHKTYPFLNDSLNFGLYICPKMFSVI